MPISYVCSPLSAPSRAAMLVNAAKANTYMVLAEREFGGRAVAPHAYLPYILDDRIPAERELALEFGRKLLTLCDRIVVFGDEITDGMCAEMQYAEELGIPTFFRAAPPVFRIGGVSDAV